MGKIVFAGTLLAPLQESDLFTTQVVLGPLTEEPFLFYDTSCSVQNCAINDTDSVTQNYCSFACCKTLLLHGQSEVGTSASQEKKKKNSAWAFRVSEDACAGTPSGTEASACGRRPEPSSVCFFPDRSRLGPCPTMWPRTPGAVLGLSLSPVSARAQMSPLRVPHATSWA